MNHVQAIKKLIDRNFTLVKRKGSSDYTRETDTIINVILKYIKESETEIQRMKPIETHRDIVFKLFGLPEELKTVDVDFLERYIKFDVVDGQYLVNGWEIDNFEVTPDYIVHKFNIITVQINGEIENYNFAKINSIINNQNYNNFKTIIPNWYTWFKHNYSENEIKEILKREKYFDYERTTR